MLVEQKFIENGYNVFRPVLENGKVDFIMEKDNKYLKIQVKTVQTDRNQRSIPMRKISHNMGEYKVKLYTENDINYFIGVDLEQQDLYILPIAFSSQYKSSISINKCQEYKNNFIQMERIIGNDNNEEDDIGKLLTDNADDNTEGIE